MTDNLTRVIHRYETPVFDSARWERFALRKGDIIVCAAPKSGTTWAQMICALLVHRSAHLPAPLTRLSRWIDRRGEPIEEVATEFEAQPWRRVLKTHTPMYGLPDRDDVFYLVCGRDPRDAFLSMVDHLDNLSVDSVKETVARAGGASPARGMRRDPNALFPFWINPPVMPWMKDGEMISSPAYVAGSFWPHRRRANVHFVHYADLLRDLEGEMRSIATWLGIAVEPGVWPGLVEAASFAAMKSRADENAPGAHLREWRDNEAFFRAGRLDEWRCALTPENLALYEQAYAARLEAPLKAWLEQGRVGAGAQLSWSPSHVEGAPRVPPPTSRRRPAPVTKVEFTYT